MCKWELEDVRVNLSHLTSRGYTWAGVDPCIAPLVQILNDGGIQTIASCCGHGNRPGNIILENGKELIICDDFDTARTMEKAWPFNIHGEVMGNNREV